MPKFRKKPVEIEAWQFDGTKASATPILERTGNAYWVNRSLAGLPNQMDIRTLEGTMTADVGDWIICGVKGEFYPCKPDIFEATYEEVALSDDGSTKL